MRGYGESLLHVVFILLVPSEEVSRLTAQSVLLRGRGASFPERVYKAWEPSYRAYRQQFVTVQNVYYPEGSGEGKRAILKGPSEEVEYAGSDSLLSTSEQEQRPELKMFPTMAGALCLAYNLPELQGTLKLTRDQIVGIYNGTYSKWNDTTFQQSNPGEDLPNEKITVLARADKSGSTDMFTTALSKFSEAWRNRPGQGRFSKGVNESGYPHHWDSNVIKMFGQTTRGMSGLILSIKHTIGYLSVADAKDIGGLKCAQLQNLAGEYVEAKAGTVQPSMDYFAENTHNLTNDISDSPEKNSYPIAGYTYFIVYMNGMPYCDRAVELVRYIEWFMTHDTPRAECNRSSMVPLSKAVVQKVTSEVLKLMTCGPERTNVWQLVAQQKSDEFWETQTWRTPVAVTTTILLVALMGISVYFVYQRMKLRKMIDNNEWDIPIEDVIFYFDEKAMSGGKSKIVGFRSVKSFRSLDEIPEGMELLTQILQWPGKWKANQVGLRLLEVKSLKHIERETKRLMIWMRDSVIHTNVVRFFGLTELETDRYVISEYCSKGPMTDILQDEKYNFTLDFKFSLSNDIASGMAFLHAVGITHGNLRSSCCLIDSRWNVKIADWEYCKLLSCQDAKKSPASVLRSSAADSSRHATAFREFWTAPEILKSESEKFPVPSGDVYSFSIILQEIFTREDPYAEHADLMSPEDVLNAILNNSLRPRYTNDTPVGVRQIMEIGWGDEAHQRPSFEQILKMLRHANPTRKSMLDSMMEAMEEYTAHLEERIEERTSELVVAKHNMESLLSGLIPPHIASQIAGGQEAHAEEYDSMAVLSIELLDFPDVSKLSSPRDAVVYLNEVNAEIETVLKKYEIFRASIEGDNYTLVSGFSKKAATEDSAAIQVAHLALDIADIVIKLPQPSFHTRPIRLRYGAHVGRVIGALIGGHTPRFCVLGGAVKAAVFLKESSLPGKIHISEALHAVITKRGFRSEKRQSAMFTISDTLQATYWLTGRDCAHTDLSSDLSSDSGIDGVVTEKQPTVTSSKLKEQRDEKCVTADVTKNGQWIGTSAVNRATEKKLSQREKWEKVFSNPEDTTITVFPDDDIELIEVCNDQSFEDNERFQMRETTLSSTSSKFNTELPQDGLKNARDSSSLDSSPTNSCDSQGENQRCSNKPRSKTNRVSPMVFV